MIRQHQFDKVELVKVTYALRSSRAHFLGDQAAASRRRTLRDVMRKARVRVLVAMTLLASVAAPNSAAAQRLDWDNFQNWGPQLSWEVASPYGSQVAFDRRDDEGRVYYYLTMVYKGGEIPFGKGAEQRAMRPSYWAADCRKGLVYEYDGRGRTWTQSRRAEEIRGTTPGTGYEYACGKYGR